MIINTIPLESGFKARYHRELMVKTGDIYHCPKVVELMSRLLGNKHSFDNFYFREEVLRVAACLWEYPSLKTWVTLQDKVHLSHRDFIIDTLKFIMTGNRNIPHQSWIRMLRDDTSTKVSMPVDDFFKSPNPTPVIGKLISVDGQILSIGHNMDVTLARWVSHPSGLSDLLLTMNVIFGGYYNKES